MLVARDELQRVRDLIYLLETALDDADLDLGEGAEVEAVYRSVVAAARQVTQTPLEPLAAHD